MVTTKKEMVKSPIILVQFLQQQKGKPADQLKVASLMYELYKVILNFQFQTWNNLKNTCIGQLGYGIQDCAPPRSHLSQMKPLVLGLAECWVQHTGGWSSCCLVMAELSLHWYHFWSVSCQLLR